MARPTKQGVDYFPLDVHLDDKFKFIEIKYKLEGFAILVKLLQKIYSCGYWYKWTDDEILIFADENRTDLTLVDDVVKEAVKREIFDSGLFEKYNVLTSTGIQKRYKEIVKRRKDVVVITQYLLIDNINGVNDNINEVNDNIESTPSKHDDSKSTQSKGKESKVNKTKEIIMTFTESDFIKVLENIDNYPVDVEKDLAMFKRLTTEYPSVDVIEAIKDYAAYKLDNPLTPKSNPRTQINTSFKKCVEWKKCLKKKEIDTRNGIPPSDSVLGEREEEWI